MEIFPLSFIIGYRHNLERFNNLKKVLDWLGAFNNVEVILVEQDTNSKISHLNLGVRHIFTKSDKPYNRSWAFNVGLKYSQSNFIVFSDCDLIMRPDEFIQSVNELQNYDMVSPYKSVIDLEQGESRLPMREIFEIDRAGRGENDNQKINIAGGISIFRKDAISKIGGWDQNFMDWGCEDNFQERKIKTFLTNKEMPYKCYHLYHNRSTPNMINYQRNLTLLDKLMKLSDEDLVKYINNTQKTFAMLNLYE